MKILKSVVALLLYALSSYNVLGLDVYSKCLMPGDLRVMGEKGSTFMLSPVNHSCKDRCTKECEGFLRKFDPFAMLNANNPNKDSKMYNGLYVLDINKDVVLDCQTQCQDPKSDNPAFNSKFFDVYMANQEDLENQDIFFKTCVELSSDQYNPIYQPSSGCQKPICSSGDGEKGCDKKKGYVSFYKTLSAPIEISKICDDSSGELINRILDTGYDVKPDDTINIKLIGGDSQNRLYLCGKKEINVEPIFSNLDKNYKNCSSILDGSKWFNIPWKNRYSHKYLSSLSDEDWKKIQNPSSAKEFWENLMKNKDISTSYAGWGARNPNFFNTGIQLQNGDELSISWEGQYQYKIGKSINIQVIKREKDKDKEKDEIYTKQCLINTDPNSLLKDCLWRNNDTSGFCDSDCQKTCKEIWYNNSHLLVKNSDSDSFISDSVPKSVLLAGEEFRIGGVERFALTPNKDGKQNTSPEIKKLSLGLSASIVNPDIKNQKLDQNNVQLFNAKSINCKCNQKEDQSSCSNHNNSCYCIDKNNFTTGDFTYSLTGIVSSDLFKDRKELSLSHYDGYSANAQNYQQWFSDNNGGYKLKINWGGCPKIKGENVQYAVSSEIKNQDSAKSLSWTDVTSEDWEQGNIVIKDSGRLYFRIKLESNGDGIYAPHNTHGQYYINITKGDKNDSAYCSKNGFVQNIVRFIKNTLIGENGVVEKIYKNVIKQGQKVVLALVILALTFTALSYMMGLARYSTEDFIKLVLKYVFVIVVVSENSWLFFKNYVIPLFIDGSVELIAKYVSASSLYINNRACIEVLKNDPYAVFAVFDSPINLIFSVSTWERIWAIMTNGLPGFFTATIIAYSLIFYYLPSIVKAISMFIFSLIMNAMLITIAPIFLVTILFQKTKSMFDAWLKNLISYALQPLFVFLAILILNFVILMLIYNVFNFTACSTCFMQVDIDLGFWSYHKCWIKGFLSILGTHTPPNTSGALDTYSAFYSFGMTFIGGLLIWLIASCMTTLSAKMADLAAFIVTGSPMRHASVAESGAGAVDFAATKTQLAVSQTASSFTKEKNDIKGKDDAKNQ